MDNRVVRPYHGYIMKLKPAFVLNNYRNTKGGWRYFRVLGWGMTGLSMFGGKNHTFGVKVGQ